MERYIGTGAWHNLLSYNPTLGGTPVRLLRARWLLEQFGGVAKGTPPSLHSLMHRQRLEREHPDAFADNERLSTLLYEAGTGGAFPGIVALSYCWLDRHHPDPEDRTMMELWLPALEWYFAERVSMIVRLADAHGAEDPPGRDVLDRADYGVFIDFSSMMQHPDDANGIRRTPTEEGLFKHALHNLDVVYAHRGTVSMLTTRLPDGLGAPAADGDAPDAYRRDTSAASRGYASSEDEYADAGGFLLTPEPELAGPWGYTAKGWVDRDDEDEQRRLGHVQVDAAAPRPDRLRGRAGPAGRGRQLPPAPGQLHAGRHHDDRGRLRRQRGQPVPSRLHPFPPALRVEV